ncbi:hypothetical protein, partial [Akkermansia sp.]|uniref:hypothetical protein n=1 Tax=Akkermansia sp. TaxID=1872421 RepID=UPI003AB7678D
RVPYPPYPPYPPRFPLSSENGPSRQHANHARRSKQTEQESSYGNGPLPHFPIPQGSYQHPDGKNDQMHESQKAPSQQNKHAGLRTFRVALRKAEAEQPVNEQKGDECRKRNPAPTGFFLPTGKDQLKIRALCNQGRIECGMT